MKIGLFLPFLAVSLGVLAETTPPDRIHSINRDLAHSEALVFMESGLVLKAREGDHLTIKALQEAYLGGETLRVDFNSDRFISGLESADSQESEAPIVSDYATEKDNFTPTVLKSVSEAKNIFNKLRGRPRRSAQCYHKAHVWAYESNQKFGLNSMKAFLFFTTKYIREYNYQWWFHVAPMTYVKENGITSEYMLDWQYLNSPSSVGNWTKIFVKNRPCVEVSKYSQYANNQEKEYCYISKYLMYYYQPKDLEAYERYGAAKTYWFDWELNEAYDLGFGIKN